MNDIHATTEQLLARRDGLPLDAGVAGHIADCETCQRQLEQLAQARDALCALADPAPDMALWNRISAQHQAAAPRRDFSVWQLALAASLAAIATSLVVLQAVPQLQAPSDINPVSPVSQVTPGSTGDAMGGGQLTVASLKQRSRNLEDLLTRLGPEPSVRTVRDTTAVESLQASIALIDYQLSLPAGQLTAEERQELWQQRVDLMESLVTVRVAADRRNSI